MTRIAAVLPFALVFAAAVSAAGPTSPVHGWLGVFLEPRSDRVAIAEVVPNSPAARGGLQVGDVVLELAGRAIDSVDELIEQLATKQPGDAVDVVVRRDRKRVTLRVELGARPDDGAPRPTPAAGVGGGHPGGDRGPEAPAPKPAADPAPPQDPAEPGGKPFLGVAIEGRDVGLKVVEVLADAPAAAAGVAVGDVLRAVDGRAVPNLDELDAAMRALRPGRQCMLLLLRGGRSVELAVTVGKAAPSEPAVDPAEPEPAPEPAPLAKAEPRPALAYGDDLTAARRVGRERGRDVFVVFRANWCVNCAALDKALNDERLREPLTAVERVRLDAEDEGRLAARYGVQALPHLLLLDPKSGKPRAELRGYQPPEKLAAFLAKARQSTRTDPAEVERVLGEIQRLRGELDTMKQELDALEDARRRMGELERSRREVEATKRSVEASEAELRQTLRELGESMEKLRRGR